MLLQTWLDYHRFKKGPLSLLFSFPLDLLVSFSEVTPYSFFCVNSSLLNLVMSPSRAAGFSSRLGSARLMTFSFQLEIAKWPKTSRNLDSFFFIDLGLKMITLCIYHSIQLQKHLLFYVNSWKLSWNLL